MCWATSVCGRLSGNCQNTHVYDLAAGLENFALDTERASTIHDILLRIIPYLNAIEALLDKRRVVRSLPYCAAVSGIRSIN